jgi:subtilase family serine protease
MLLMFKIIRAETSITALKIWLNDLTITSTLQALCSAVRKGRETTLNIGCYPFNHKNYD